VGTVVHVYRDGQAYEVEFATLDGTTAAVVTLEASQLRPGGGREIPHARELANRWDSPNELPFLKVIFSIHIVLKPTSRKYSNVGS
jgi:hypothetical protein